MKSPRVLSVQPDNVPKLLKYTDRWGLWSKGKDKAGGRYDKIPIHPKTGYNTDAHCPNAWQSIDQAVEIYRRGRVGQRSVSGIFFDLPKNPDPIYVRDDGTPLYLIGLDFDECVDWVECKPVISREVQTILTSLSTPYHEISPSGTGVRTFVLYPKPLKGGNKDHREMYSQGRFLTVTGHGAGDILEAGPILEQLEEKWFRKGPRAQKAQNKAVMANPFANAVGGFELPEVVVEGERNEVMLAYIGSLRGKGIPEDVLSLAVRQANQDRFRPPLDEDELLDLIMSVVRVFRRVEAFL